MRSASIVLVVILSISILTYGDVFGEEAVQITGHKKIADDSGLTHIIGIVENSGMIPVGFVRVTASLFDENGKPLPSYETVAMLKTLLPGYVTPFDMPISDRSVGERLSSYKLSIKWNIVDPKPEKFEFSGINAFTLTHIDPSTFEYRSPHGNHHDYNEPHAHSETSGHIANTGEITTKSIKAAAIWYDKEGKFYGFDWQDVSKKLAPGESARFVFMTHPRAMGFYSLIVESDSYVGMLKEKDGRMIPVYEASKANMKFESNGINISKVQLVDENNQPVGDAIAGKMVLLQAMMKNNMSTKQKFISIYHIVDSKGNPVMLFWMSSAIPAGESLETAISWIPEGKGAYTLQVFLWESMINPVPLGDYSEITIKVSG